MQPHELINNLLRASEKKEHIYLLKKYKNLLDIELARDIKNTCYESWTKEPEKTRNAAAALKAFAELLPNAEVKALAEWVRGFADLTDGKIEKAIKDLDTAHGILKKLGKLLDAAQTQVAKLIALALLGRYEEATDCGKKALKVFEKFGDELAAGKIEMNLSNIVARRELHREAEKYCLSARKRFSKLNETAWLTMAENGLANTYAELNDFRKSEKFYKQALARARAMKMLVTEAEIEASIGNLALFRGKFSDALRYLEMSRRKYEELKMPHQIAIADLEIADIYLELNLSKEAFEIYERVSGELQVLKLQGEEARARASFGRVAANLHERKTARRELKKSARLYLAEKNEVGAAAVLLSEANLELSAKNFEKCLSLAEDAEKMLGDSENVRHKLTAKWLKAESLCKLKKFNQAEKLLETTFAKALRQEQSNLAQASLNSLGKLALEMGDARKAEKHFKKAIRLIEQLRAPLAAEEFRMAFLADKLAPFENLAKIYLRENKLKDAFAMIEKARSRVLAETLGGEFDSFEETKTSAKLVNSLKILREELNWFYSRLNRADESELANLQIEAKKREKQIADVMRQIESTKTKNKTSVRELQNGATLKNLQNLLGAKKALIEFVKFGETISAFVIDDKKIHFIADLAHETEIISLLENLQFQFGSLRFGAKRLGKFINEMKKRADFYLQKLYEKLLEPLESFIGKRDLVIAPVGATHYVPFHALYNGENYLIESREVVYTPSAAVWRFLNEKPLREAKNALLIGFADEKIPFVNEEIKHLQKIFKSAKSFIGKDATFSAYTENAPKFDVLHFACHGQFRAENPLFSSLRLADGFVTVRDICAQTLSAGLVTLSACETGLNKISAGDEILGLARGFLSAGAHSLVLSLWTVNDEAAAELMTDFYKNLQRGTSVSASLRLAQNNLIRRGAHPYFWSPFVLIGR
jgi:CHAT domain-containing protein